MKLNIESWSQANINSYHKIVVKIKSFDFSLFDSEHPYITGRPLYKKFSNHMYPEVFSFRAFLYLARNIKTLDLDTLFCPVCGKRVNFFSKTCRRYCSSKCGHYAENLWNSHVKTVSDSINKNPSDPHELVVLVKSIVKDFDFSRVEIEKRSCTLVNSTRLEYEKFRRLYGDVFNIYEFVYLARHHNDDEKDILNQLFCSVCGRKKSFTSSVRIPKFCSAGCYSRSEESKLKRQQTCLEIYGNPFVSQNPEIREKIKKTNMKKFGHPSSFQSKEVQEKYRNNFLKNYGVENPSQLEEVKRKKEQTCEEHFGVKYSFQSEEIREKGRETCRQKYNADYYSQTEEAKEAKKQTNLGNFGVVTNLLLPEVVKRRNKTLRKKYGVSPFTSEKVRKKAWQSKKENGTWSASAPEERVYKVLKKFFPRVIRQYKDEVRYPFYCDFYVPINDLFIELNESWTHGKRQYNPKSKEDNNKLKMWKRKSKKSDYYKAAIETWTVRDPLKFSTAEKNNLNYFAFYTEDEVYKWLATLYDKQYYEDLTLEFETELLRQEYEKIQSIVPNYERVPNTNNIILNFQQREFFKEEVQKWKDPSVRQKLVQNRIRYIGKGLGKLTRREILRGLKIAGIVQGYSHFSPHWIRKFIQDYNVTSIYDPCGGWGHRLIGLPKDFLYVYNDINTPVYNGAKNISSFLTMTNKYFYNCDCSKGIPKDFINRIDAVFTCPPYHNKEMYSKIGAENLSYREYLDWWDNTVRQCLRLNARLFAFVIDLDHEDDLASICITNNLTFVGYHSLRKSKSHLAKNSKSYEALLVFSNREKQVRSKKGLKKVMFVR